mmetsp:Transcript_75856/g.180198  ORF Transcript_75856/g.180198 Transcript_75856/m.180198 type:complete len:772 (+) Transcript_75856:158-2473(+)
MGCGAWSRDARRAPLAQNHIVVVKAEEANTVEDTGRDRDRSESRSNTNQSSHRQSLAFEEQPEVKIVNLSEYPPAIPLPGQLPPRRSSSDESKNSEDIFMDEFTGSKDFRRFPRVSLSEASEFFLENSLGVRPMSAAQSAGYSSDGCSSLPSSAASSRSGSRSPSKAGSSASASRARRMMSAEKSRKRREWVRNLLQQDPRTMIATFFQPGDERGPLGTLEGDDPDIDWSGGGQTEFFSVWRPTSADAIRVMLEGRGTGKGLNIKGKSAKRGELSGFVPFLQISQNDHKSRVSTVPIWARCRVFFHKASDRDKAVAKLRAGLAEIEGLVADSTSELTKHDSGECLLDDMQHEAALQNMKLRMEDTSIHLLDHIAGAFGADVPMRLLWEVFVNWQDIAAGERWDTGRPSEPAYMDMNLQALRDSKEPRAVLWQQDSKDPCNPRTFLMAYEEEQVRPVCSDFDAFLVGSKGMKFRSIPDDQVSILSWCVHNIELLLERQEPRPWTSQWLDVLKAEANKGFHPDIPPLGFGDPTSSEIMRKAVEKLKMTGAIRHGAECFNYYFPQELDTQFLVIYHGYTRVPWRYLSLDELLVFLKKMIGIGYTFPLNPKWILCDLGWYEVFECLLEQDWAREALHAWFPPHSNLIERMCSIHARYPHGLTGTAGSADNADDGMEHEMAQLHLKRYMALQRARRKLRMALIWLRLRKTSHDSASGSGLLPAGSRDCSPVALASGDASPEVMLLNQSFHAAGGQGNDFAGQLGQQVLPGQDAELS